MEGKNNPVAFHGVLWSRYSYVLEDLSASNTSKDDNRFEIDRVYLGFTAQLGERYTGRAILEMQNANSGQDKMLTFLKRAEVLIAKPFGLEGSEIRAGQTEGLVTGTQEKAWGYRVVQKAPLELFLGVSPTYLGVGWLAKWAGGLLETDVLVANRAAFNRDVASDADSKYKTFGARAYVKPIRSGAAKGLGAGAYVQIAPSRGPSSDNQTLWFGGHGYYDGEISGHAATLGLQFDVRTTKASTATGSSDVTATVLSAVARAYATKRLELFARTDVVDFDTDHEDILLGSGDSPTGASAAAAQTLLVIGASHAYTNSLRSILDVSIRSLRDDILQEVQDAAPQPVDFDSEVIVSARLDAKL